VDQVPEVMRRRPLSLRAFDERHMMVDAALVAGAVADGAVADAAIRSLLARPEVAYPHAHYAVRGCYAARIARVP
jgi:hypothetical protein